MMTQLHWIDGPWSGKLALASRPRGADWLGDEMASWQRAGVDTVVSLLTSGEEQDLDLKTEKREVKIHGMEFVSFPIADRQTPVSEAKTAELLEKLDSQLSSGKNIAIHCRQGIGRTGLLAACLLVLRGWLPEEAVRHLSSVRGVAIPETEGQRSWIDHYAAMLAVKA